jgi:antirestriction protein
MNTNPKIWITSYGAYNDGRLDGRWIDLTEISDLSEIYDAVKEDTGEEDPELMICDYEYLPADMYTEAAGPDDLQAMLDYAWLDKEELEILAGWLEFTGWDSSKTVQEQLQDAQDHFYGKYESFSDFAYQLAEDCCIFDGKNETLERYFNWEAWERDLSYDYHYSEAGNVYSVN